MKSPDLYRFTYRTREQIEASFVPCCYCGQREKLTSLGVYKIDHDYSKHPGMEPRRTERMSTSELIGNPTLEEAGL